MYITLKCNLRRGAQTELQNLANLLEELKTDVKDLRLANETIMKDKVV